MSNLDKLLPECVMESDVNRVVYDRDMLTARVYLYSREAPLYISIGNKLKGVSYER